MQRIYGSFLAGLMSGGAWVLGRVIYVILRAVYRGEPRAIAMIVATLVAIGLLIWLV
jgi:hypothetical protein